MTPNTHIHDRLLEGFFLSRRMQIGMAAPSDNKHFMKRFIKTWWSTIQPISTKNEQLPLTSNHWTM